MLPKRWGAFGVGANTPGKGPVEEVHDPLGSRTLFVRVEAPRHLDKLGYSTLPQRAIDAARQIHAVQRMQIKRRQGCTAGKRQQRRHVLLGQVG